MVTLRRERMYEFLERLMNPRETIGNYYADEIETIQARKGRKKTVAGKKSVKGMK